MNDLTVVDSIYLDAQQKEEVRRLSSLGYSSKDIAVSLGLSPEDDFWTSKAEPWTSVKVYNGIDLKADKALKK